MSGPRLLHSNFFRLHRRRRTEEEEEEEAKDKQGVTRFGGPRKGSRRTRGELFVKHTVYYNCSILVQ